MPVKPAPTVVGTPLFMFVVAVMMLSMPDAAYAQASLQPLENLADFLVNFLTGPFARSLAIIAVAVLGFMGFTGRMRWGFAGSVIVGIALVFGGGTIVDSLSSNV